MPESTPPSTPTANPPTTGRTLSLPEGLGDYLAARDQQRQERVERQWAALSKREQRLVREASVMGYVSGFRASPYRKDIPPDSAIVTEVLSAADAMSDLYPTLHRAGRRKKTPARVQPAEKVSAPSAPEGER